MEARWLSADEERAWRAYHRMSQLLQATIAAELARSTGLSWPDYDVLSNLTDTPDRRCRLTDLAASMLWSSSRMSHHIDRMERRGLVRRETDPDDGRVTVIALTDEGWRAIEEAAPSHVASVRRHLIDRLSPAQVRHLERISRTVLEALKEERSLP